LPEPNRTAVTPGSFGLVGLRERACLPGGRLEDRQRARQGHCHRVPDSGAVKRKVAVVIRVVLADDHTIVREGLKHLLAAAGDIAVVGEGVQRAGGDRARARAGDRCAAVGHVDARQERHRADPAGPREKPKVRILVLSMHEEHQYAVRAVRAGASGYLTKESATLQLVEAIRKVAAGGAFISSEVAQQLALGAMPGAAAGPLHASLSDREFQILLLIATANRSPRSPGSCSCR
jgi:DNA-binding NarL/FixJ family response regulator